MQSLDSPTSLLARFRVGAQTRDFVFVIRIRATRTSNVRTMKRQFIFIDIFDGLLTPRADTSVPLHYLTYCSVPAVGDQSLVLGSLYQSGTPFCREICTLSTAAPLVTSRLKTLFRCRLLRSLSPNDEPT
jgi:hypothetical protein